MLSPSRGGTRKTGTDRGWRRGGAPPLSPDGHRPLSTDSALSAPPATASPPDGRKQEPTTSTHTAAKCRYYPPGCNFSKGRTRHITRDIRKSAGPPRENVFLFFFSSPRGAALSYKQKYSFFSFPLSSPHLTVPAIHRHVHTRTQSRGFPCVLSVGLTPL